VKREKSYFIPLISFDQTFLSKRKVWLQKKFLLKLLTFRGLSFLSYATRITQHVLRNNSHQMFKGESNAGKLY